MCVNCQPLVKAIDAYLQKADDDLAKTLASEGYCQAKRTAKIIAELEDEVAAALVDERDYILEAAEQSADLASFAADIWPGVQLNDVLASKLAVIFAERFAALTAFCSRDCRRALVSMFLHAIS
ncbi:MAG: hypothetical protein OSJ64_00810 [Firmicutes bacterium]|nr:hypothetical protein [Bacillota bacterium]